MAYPIVLVPPTILHVLRQVPPDFPSLVLPHPPTPPAPLPAPVPPTLASWLKPLLPIYQPLWQSGVRVPKHLLPLLQRQWVQLGLLTVPPLLIMGLGVVLPPPLPLLILGISLGISIYIVILLVLRVLVPLQYYLGNLQRYQRAIVHWQTATDQLQQHYQQHQAQWEQQCQHRQQQQQAQIHQWRRVQIAQLLAQTQSVDGEDSDAPPGLAENPQISRFPVLLQQVLGNQLQVRLKAGPYTPDFAYIDARSGLHVDIEIDEPYSTHKVRGKDVKVSTHCSNGKSGKKDSDRNQFFLKRGWCVIRFSEFQIFFNPEGCVREIVRLIALTLSQPELFAPYEQLPALAPFPTWTEAMSKQMAEQGFRVSYLQRLGIGSEPISAGNGDDDADAAPPKRLVERNLPGKIRKD